MLLTGLEKRPFLCSYVHSAFGIFFWLAFPAFFEVLQFLQCLGVLNLIKNVTFK